MEQRLSICQQEDGFWVGRRLKDGSLGKGSYRLTGEDIMTMFTAFFSDYCDDTGSGHMLMRDGRGRLIVTRLLPTELGK